MLLYSGAQYEFVIKGLIRDETIGKGLISIMSWTIQNIFAYKIFRLNAVKVL